MKKNNFVKFVMFLSMNPAKTGGFFDSPEKLYTESLKNNPGKRTGWISKITVAPDILFNDLKNKTRISLGYVYNNVDFGIHLNPFNPGFYLGMNSANWSVITNLSILIDNIYSSGRILPMHDLKQVSLEICKNHMLFGFSTFFGISLNYNFMEKSSYFSVGLVLGIQRNQTEALILDRKIEKKVKQSKIELEANRRYSNWLKTHSIKEKNKYEVKQKKSDKDKVIVRNICTDQKI